MRTFRILLLVLLTMLLPLRGALAEVAHCSGNSSEESYSLQSSPSDEGTSHHTDENLHGVTEQVVQASPDDVGASALDPCNLCTASCASPSFLTAPPSMVQSLSVAETRYPALDAPPESHTSEGQERPPRTI